MVLAKCAGNHLPVELLEAIEILLLPREIPTSAHPPNRTFRSVFLYHDLTSRGIGPFTVYSDPAVAGGLEITPQTRRSAWLGPPRTEPGFVLDGGDHVFQVKFLRNVLRVADELHMLWSMSCLSISGPETASLPTVSMQIDMPAICRPAMSSADPPVVRFRVQGDRPITLQNRFPRSVDLWGDALEIVDVETGHALPHPSMVPQLSGYNRES